MDAISSVVSIQKQLKEGIAKGYWTIEQLDVKPPNSLVPDDRYRNLARESMPVIEVIDDKDLPPLPTGVTPAQKPNLPLTLEDLESSPF